MGSIADLLFHFAGPSLGTVIHLGAGAVPTVGDDGSLRIRRLVLVEGDPETAARLSASAGKRPGIEVLQGAVSADGAELLWTRFSLPALNGPRDADELVRLFPRLRVLSTQPLSSVPVAAMLSGVGLLRSDDALPNVLVIDLPGQAGAILRTLASTPLKAIDWIVLRDLRHFAAADGAAIDAAILALRAAHFERHEADAALDVDPLWRHVVLRFQASMARLGTVNEQLGQTTQDRDTALARVDVQAHEMVALQARLETLHAHVELLEADSQAVAQRGQQFADDFGALRSQRDDATAQLEAAQAQLRAQRNRDGSQLDAQLQQIAGLEARLQEQQAQLALALARSAQLETLDEQLDQARRQLEERVQHSAALETRLQEQHMQMATAASGHAQLEALCAEQGRTIAALEPQARQAVALQAQMQALRAQLNTAASANAQLEAVRQQQDEARSQLEAQVRQMSEHEVQLRHQLEAAAVGQDHLQAARKQQDETMVQLQRQMQALQSEGQEQRTQLTVSAARNDELTRQQQQLLDQLATTRKERDEQTHWHAENAKWAKALQADNERLATDIQGLQRNLGQLTPELQEAKATVQSLQRDAIDRDQRQHMMDREVLRAQAQLDLIKDVLIREKNF